MHVDTRVRDIEGSSDLIRVFPLNNARYCPAENVQQSLDVQVVGRLWLNKTIYGIYHHSLGPKQDYLFHTTW